MCLCQHRVLIQLCQCHRLDTVFFKIEKNGGINLTICSIPSVYIFYFSKVFYVVMHMIMCTLLIDTLSSSCYQVMHQESSVNVPKTTVPEHSKKGKSFMNTAKSRFKYETSSEKLKLRTLQVLLLYYLLLNL